MVLAPLMPTAMLATSLVPKLAIDPSVVTMLGWALAGYVLFLLGISIYASRRVKNEADYVVAGRRLPLSLACGTLIATWFGAATMFAAAEAARDDGLLGVVLDPLACAATLVFAGIFFARPLWNMQLYTMADFYRLKYGPSAELTGALIQVPSYFSWIALQYTALARILELYFGLPLVTGIVVVAGVTLVYTLIGGMWSVTLTDTVQIVVALTGLVVLAVVTLSDAGLGDGDPVRGLTVVFLSVATTHPDHLRWFPSEFTALAILPWLAAWGTGLFGNIPGQDLQQRVFAAKSGTTAMQACIIAGVLYFVFGMIPVTLGLASLVTHPEGTLDPVGFLAGEYLSPVMLVIFVVAVMSMIVSTATSAVLAPATILGHNLLRRVPWLSRSPLTRDKACVVLVSLGGIALATWGKKLMELLDVALSIQFVALFIPVTMGIYGKPRGPLAAVLSMLMGFGAWAVVFSLSEIAGESPSDVVRMVTAVPAVFWGVGCSGIGYFLGQVLSPR